MHIEKGLMDSGSLPVGRGLEQNEKHAVQMQWVEWIFKGENIVISEIEERIIKDDKEFDMQVGEVEGAYVKPLQFSSKNSREGIGSLIFCKHYLNLLYQLYYSKHI